MLSGMFCSEAISIITKKGNPLHISATTIAPNTVSKDDVHATATENIDEYT
jgi:hypothetical protein